MLKKLIANEGLNNSHFIYHLASKYFYGKNITLVYHLHLQLFLYLPLQSRNLWYCLP